MGDTLADLTLSNPRVGRVSLLAVVALLVLYLVINLETLLQKGIRLQLFLYSKLNFNPS